VSYLFPLGGSLQLTMFRRAYDEWCLSPGLNEKKEDLERDFELVETFCMEFLERLCKLERLRINQPTSIEDFVRLDLGMKVRGGEVSFFVNEVTRLPFVDFLTCGRDSLLADMLKHIISCMVKRLESRDFSSV